MNMTFWSHCQGLIRRLTKCRPLPRVRHTASWAVESLESRMLLSAVPALVADIAPGLPSSYPQGMLTIGSTTYFSATDDAHGQELWRTDGTAAGTRLVKDINSGTGGAGVGRLTNVNGMLYFTADDGVNGFELWKSDGTAAGTVLVKNLDGGASSSFPAELANINGTLYFTAHHPDTGRELWKSDGTVSGTTLVADVLPGHYTGYYGGTYPQSSSPSNLTNISGKIFFSASDNQGHNGLWVSDGTAAGTKKLSTLAQHTSQLTNVNGTLFFMAVDGDRGAELWKSDGTVAGTQLVKDIFPGWSISYDPYSGTVYTPNASRPTGLTASNGMLFFAANDAYGRFLWKSDGTEAGTTRVRTDLSVDFVENYNENILEFNGAVYFAGYSAANGAMNGIELWKTDGTASGTTLVKDINPGANGSYPIDMVKANGALYFRAWHSSYGTELWKTDGTGGGTQLVADMVPGPESFDIWSATALNDKLLLSADDRIRGYELWIVGTPVAAPSLSVSGFPATITAGTAGGFTVTVKNADGSINTGFRGTIRFTSTDPQAVLPAEYTFTSADNGKRTFSATLKSAGTHTINVIDKQTPSIVGSAGTQVKAAAASTMTLSGFPSTTTAGSAGSVTVTLKDAYGNVATDYMGTVRFTSSDSKASLPSNYTFTAADAGKRTFNVTLKTAGKQSITVTDIARPSLTSVQSGITVKSGAATRFLISGPTSARVGAPFSLTLTVQDAYGNVVTGYTGTVRFTSSDKSALLPPNYTFKSTDGGVRTFSSIILLKRGTQTVSITDRASSSLNASLSVSVR